MTLAPLLDQLRQNAEEDAERRLAAAKEAAAHRHRAAAARRAHRRDEALAAARRELAHERQRRAGGDALEAARLTLAARARFVDRVLAACVRRATRLVDHRAFARAMREELDAALACLPDEEVVIGCPPAAGPVMRAAAATAGRRARVVEEPALTPGFVASTADGRVRVDATVARRLALQRDRLAIELVRDLTEDSP